jgi:hypothetical protein
MGNRGICWAGGADMRVIPLQVTHAVHSRVHPPRNGYMSQALRQEAPLLYVLRAT